MTYREFVKKQYPERISNFHTGGVMGCPFDIDSGATRLCRARGERRLDEKTCTKCWDQDYILDDEPSKYPNIEFKYDVLNHATTDVETILKLYNTIFGLNQSKRLVPEIKDVKFNGPATIVFWADGTKTVVKARDEDFDKEKGLAMAISRKALGNTGSYYDEFEKWLKEEEEEETKYPKSIWDTLVNTIQKNDKSSLSFNFNNKNK